MAHPVSRKLSNAFEGALAGGGDPATSPLYVFGPFLKLIVAAGVAQITFGASVWLVVFTVAMVSAMYRQVMTWVTDGSGGSGLSEEEFGGWAVKVNAGITFIEYTLTFLVSMAAMVTFIADRIPVLNATVLGLPYRTVVAIGLSVLTGWLVNRGPKMAARTFGPATGGVLLLLWVMIGATIFQRGLQFPALHLAAFRPEYLFQYTLGGYARILAVMTGIEVFANLVAAYSGAPAQRSRKAFGSLLIVMGTTSATMLIVGPAIFALANPADPEISVFTQTMDALLPEPLPYIGTLVGIAVLLSASAASAQGLQNLALGLGDRHYVPAVISQRNRFDVADKPVWIQVTIVALCFLVLGTHEETYLALYAAGVFILLTMTGWAAAKRLFRQLRQSFSHEHVAILVGTVIAAVLTSGATLIIFAERFLEGAWIYFILIPMFYAFFTYSRQRLGAPSSLREALGRRVEAMIALGLPLRQPRPKATSATLQVPVTAIPSVSGTSWDWGGHPASIRRVVVTLDGSPFSERVLPTAQALCRYLDASLLLASVVPAPDAPRLLNPATNGSGQSDPAYAARTSYLQGVAERIQTAGLRADCQLGVGRVAETISQIVDETHGDLLAMSTHGRAGMSAWLLGRTTNAVVQLVNKPVLLVRPEENGKECDIRKALVALDGSARAERILSYAALFGASCQAEIILLSVPEVPEPELYGPGGGALEDLRSQAEASAQAYLGGVVAELRTAGLNARAIVAGSRPAMTIVEIGEAEAVDLVLITTHGQGSMDRLMLGSVADRVVHHVSRPVLLVPVRNIIADG